MNKRQHDLLRLLLASPEQYHVTKKLAEVLNCSERTIRNDLTVLEEESDRETWFCVFREPGKGIRVIVHNENKRLSYLEGHVSKEEKLPSTVTMLCFKLLMATDSIPMSDLRDHYYLSPTELKHQIEEVKVWLQAFDIELSIKPRIGLTVIGHEMNKRRALVSLPHEEGTPALIEQNMQAYEVHALKHLLISFSEEHTLYFTDESLNRLLIHILLMVKRIKLQHHLQLPDQDIINMKSRAMYEVILELKRAIESLFKVTLKESEIVYLAMHVLGSKMKYPLKTKAFTNLEGDKQAEQLTEVLINLLAEKTMMDFNRDQHLREGLYVHVYATLHRLRYDLPVTNPLTREIKQLYPFLFDLLIGIVTKLEEQLGFLIPEEEVAYLTLHFQAALERLDKDRQKEHSVVIVCHMGIGVSEILKVRLARAFPTLVIKATLQERELTAYIKKEPVDLIVSTLPVALKAPPSVVVSPLLNEDDQANLRMWAEKTSQVDHNKHVSLKTYIHPGFVFIHPIFEHPYELIEFVTNRMVQAGVVDHEYPHQALLRERKASTAIGGGISIPHGDPAYVKQSTIALVTLKEPMNWEGEWVSLVFVLALRQEDKDKHRAIYQQLALLTEQVDKQARIISQDTIKDVLNNL